MAMKTIPSRLNPRNWRRGHARQGGDAASPAGSDRISPPTLPPVAYDPLPLSDGLTHMAPDSRMPVSCSTAPARSPPDPNPVRHWDGRPNINGVDSPSASRHSVAQGHGNGITSLESGRHETAWSPRHEVNHSAPDTTTSMLQGEPGRGYEPRFSDSSTFMKAEGELSGAPAASRGALAYSASGPVGGPPGGAHEVSGDSAQKNLQAVEGATAAWLRSNARPQAGPTTSGMTAVVSYTQVHITPDQHRHAPSVSPVQPATAAMSSNMGTSLHNGDTVDEGPQFGSQGVSSGLPMEPPTSRAPAQNESRRRQGSPGLSAAREMTPTTPPVPLPPTPAPMPQPAAGGMDSRIRDFLETHRVMKRDPGHDWLGTLIHWIAGERDKVQHQLKKAEESWRQEKQLTEELNLEIRGKNAQISKLRQDLAQASQGEVRWKNKFLKIDGERKKMDELLENHRKHGERLDTEVGRLTRELETSRRQGAEWEREANAADKRCQRADFDLNHAKAQIEQLQRARETLALESGKKTKEIGDLLAKLQRLNNELDGIETQHANKISAIRAEHASKMATTTARYEDKLAAKDGHIATLNTEHGHELAAKDQQMSVLVTGHEKDLAAKDQQMSLLVTEHERDLAAKDQQMSLLVTRHEKDLAAKDSQMALLVEQHQHEWRELKESVNDQINEATKKDRATISKLKQQIASYNKDDYVPIDDAIFIHSFQALVQDVNQLASKIREPTVIDFDRSLDPTNCLDRNASQRNWIWPRFVRNLCWNVLLRGFFGLPLGFGALGHQGEGYRVLYPTYQATAQVDPDGEPGSALTIPYDQKTNVGRAWHFEKILAAVCSDTGIETEYRVLFRGNVMRVARELYDTLHHVLSGQIDPACFQRASEIAHKLGILALEMGTQRARVVLETCQYQDRPTPDEWKSDQAGATSAQVDFMMHPCLSRFGDGRRELYKKKVIVKGEFVPVWVGY